MVKNNQEDIYKILLNLENLVKMDIDYSEMDKIKNNNYQDILYNDIVIHLNYLKKEKNPFKVLPKNREFIFKLINFNFDNQIILENFLKIIIKKYHKYLPLNEIVQLTAKTDHDILNASREIYNYEVYLLKIYKMFHIVP